MVDNFHELFVDSMRFSSTLMVKTVAFLESAALHCPNHQIAPTLKTWKYFLSNLKKCQGPETLRSPNLGVKLG